MYNKQMNTLVVDINSGSVKVVLVHHKSKSLPEIFGSSKSNFYFEEKPESDVLAKSIITGLRNALGRVPKDSKIHNAFITAQNELGEGATRTEMTNRIEDEINKHFGISGEMSTGGFMHSFSKVLGQTFQNTPSSLLVNMGFESTDLSFMHFGKLGTNIRIEFGLANIARKIGKVLKIPLNLAYSNLRLFSNGLLDSKTMKKIDEVLIESEQEFKNLWDKTEHFKIDSPYSVYLVTESPFENISKVIIEGILLDSKINSLGVENKFTEEIVKFSKYEDTDQRIAILGAFSNLLV
jgi:hypothetical protein